MTGLLADTKGWIESKRRTAFEVSGFGGVPDGVFGYVARKEGECSIGSNGLYGAEHALLETGRRIAFMFAIRAGGGVVVARGLILRVGPKLSVGC